MTTARQRNWALLAAVLGVALCLWVLQRPDRPSTAMGEADSSTADGASGGRSAGPTSPRRPGPIAPRETTVAGHGWVRGQVVDEDGQAVSEGAVVLWCRMDDAVHRVRDGVLTLNDVGQFEGPGCRGQVCPELQHPFMIPAEPWSLRSGPEQILTARRLPRLWGRVVDPDGQPVAGASVIVSLPPDLLEDPTAVLPVVSARTSSDADGEFSIARIERPPCDPCQQARQACPSEGLPVVDRVLVTARAAAWAPGSAEVDLVEADSADEPVSVSLGRAQAAITGSLQDADGRALPRAFVLARSEVREHEQHRAEADDGVFAFEGLGAGSYTVRAIQDARELWRQAGVEPGEVVSLALSEAAVDVEVVVVDEHGRPVADARVDGGPFVRARSDAQGLVRAQRVMPGAYILRVRPRGAPAQAHDLEVPAAPGGPDPSSVRVEVALPP